MWSRSIVSVLLLVTACKSRDNTGSSAPPASSGSAASTAPAASGTGSAAGSAAAPAAGSAAAIDPCSYATKEEIGAAVGLPIVVMEQVSPDQCAYHPEPKPSNALYIRVSDGGAYSAMKQTMRDTEAVTGVGDDALWAKPQLLVHAGAKMISIGVMDVRWKAGDSKGVAVAAANAVIPRLR